MEYIGFQVLSLTKLPHYHIVRIFASLLVAHMAAKAKN